MTRASRIYTKAAVVLALGGVAMATEPKPALAAESLCVTGCCVCGSSVDICDGTADLFLCIWNCSSWSVASCTNAPNFDCGSTIFVQCNTD
jgi:hypothetical protein